METICYAVLYPFLFAKHKATIGLRVSDQEQIEGLDLGEHGQEAYPNFASRSGG